MTLLFIADGFWRGLRYYLLADSCYLKKKIT